MQGECEIENNMSQRKNEIPPMVLELTLNGVKIKCIKTGQILHIKYGNNQAIQLVCEPKVCKCYMVEWCRQNSPLKNKIKKQKYDINIFI